VDSSQRSSRERWHTGVREGLAVLPPLLGTVSKGTSPGREESGTKDKELAETAPALLVLGTEGDAPSDWLAAGQAMERVLPEAADCGVSASYLNQPI
jgi:hypothetical protein